MKKMPNFLRDLFSLKASIDLDVNALLTAMSDPTVRKVWLMDLFDQIQQIHTDIDTRILRGNETIHDLAIRRKAFQDILEGVLSARKRVRNPNPQDRSGFDLDSVTVQSA